MVVRAGVIPTSIRDETGAIARREADANDRLAVLFHTLLAKREDRIFQANLRREMAEQSNANWYDRYDYAEQHRQQNQPQRPRSPGAQGSVIGAPDASSVTSPSNGAPTMPGASPIPNSDRFSDASPVVSEEARNAFGQATPQQIQEAKAAQKLRPSNTSRAPSTGLPRIRNERTPRPQALYENLTPEILAAWQDAERKNGLPPGQLLYTHGLETDGGRMLGRADGQGPQGPFQWTGTLLKEKGLTVHDAQDYIKMGYASAKNMAENHQQLVKRTTAGGQAIQLSDSVNDMPSWHVLHQWGRSGGPSIVAASRLNPDMALVDLLPKNVRRRDGSTGDASEWLVNNGLHPAATVKSAYAQLEQRGAPWRTAAVTGEGVLPDADSPRQAQQRQASPPPQSQQAAPAGPQVAGGVPPQASQQQQPPRPPRDVPMTDREAAVLRGVNPRLVAAVKGGAQLALPDGYTLRPTSGYRHGDRGYHGRGAASDWQIFTPDGRPIPNRGEDTTGLYTRLARGVKAWTAENDPQLAARIGYGGAFGTQKGGGGVPDLMHYDLGGSRGRMRPNVQFARLQPLGPNERRAPAQGQTQVAQAPKQPQQQARPTEVSAQARVPVTEYPSKSPKPSEQRLDVTQDFRGPTSRVWDGASGTAQAAPTQPAAPTQQQAPYAEPTVPTPDVPLPRARPQLERYSSADAAPLPEPQVPLPMQNVPMPPARPPMQLDMPMPPPRPNIEALTSPTRSIVDAAGAPSVDEAGMSAYAPPLGAPSVDEAGMVIPPDYSGAQGVDETGFDQYLPPPPVNPQDMGTGEDYSGAQSVDEAGMELHGQRKELPGTSIGNIRQPYTRADRRDMAARGEQPEPQWRPPGSVSAGDWIADMVRRAKGGGTTQDGGAPILDMPLPPQGGGDVAQAMPGASTRSIAEPQQVADPGAIADMGAPSGDFDEGGAGAIGDIPPAIDDLPAPTMPPPQFDERGAGAPGNMSPETLAAMKQAMFNMKLPPPGPNAPTPENNAIVREKLRDLAAHTAPARIAQMVQEGGIPKRVGDAASSVADVARAIFSKGTPSVTGKGVATAPTNAPMAPGRPVKVERYSYNPDGTPRLPDGPPIQIPNPNQGRATTSNTPLPFTPGGGAAPPAPGIPPAPKPGAGAAATGFRKWRLPDGRTVTTKPGEAPPPGAVPVP